MAFSIAQENTVAEHIQSLLPNTVNGFSLKFASAETLQLYISVRNRCSLWIERAWVNENTVVFPTWTRIVTVSAQVNAFVLFQDDSS